MKVVRPTGSYSVVLPEHISESVDTRVASYWITGEPLLLQLSSYQRVEGPPMPAHERLAQRMASTGGSWAELERNLCKDPTVDQAAAAIVSDDVTWLHAYFVWPHLTVYATVSGPAPDALAPDTWAANALETISVSKK
jgi:hypothetical protein